ncbi:hypothetical protein ACLBTQ_35105, partial [Pseudomonas aeruginosa]
SGCSACRRRRRCSGSWRYNPLRWAEVVRLGQEGWELVSVQPLMRGVTEIGNQNAQGWAWGVALPVSYLLFFKRATS